MGLKEEMLLFISFKYSELKRKVLINRNREVGKARIGGYFIELGNTLFPADRYICEEHGLIRTETVVPISS